jgi:thiomorpholine-carboxylate dehydrogenase
MYIAEPEVRALLTYEVLIPAIRQALIDFSASPQNDAARPLGSPADQAAGQVVQPPRTILRAGNAEGENNGWFAVMPVIAGGVMGVKTVTFFPGNAALGLPTHMAIIELLSRATGQPLAVMDGRLITEMRTAAVSAVALDALAPENIRSLGILGSGVQARAHIRALRLARPSLQEIRIWSRTPAHAERLAAECGARAVPIEAAAAADVVLTVTSSPTPVLQGRWLAPHAVVLAVGAVGAALRELDNDAMLSSSVVADSRAALERESGDVRLSGAPIHAEIGQILSGRASMPACTRIVFKSVGMAIEDLTAARLVWAARKLNPGPAGRQRDPG